MRKEVSMGNDTYVYLFEGNLYINITNKCSNACTFCIRNDKDGIGKHHLWLRNEPQAELVLAEIAAVNSDSYDEIVFCGFGESTERLDCMLEVARELRGKGHVIRLNTNGLGSAINGYDIVPRLAEVMDVVSISLNESDAEKYMEVSRPKFGIEAFAMLLDFTRKCVAAKIKTVLTVVDIIGAAEIEKCEKIAASVGALLRVRVLI